MRSIHDAVKGGGEIDKMKKIAIFFVVVMICSFVAEAATLTVPFFRNPIGGTTRGVIGIKNTSQNDQVVTLTYSSQTSDGAVSQPFVTFELLANAAIAWRPIEDVTQENVGQAIPNMTIEFVLGSGNVSCCGSALIEGGESLAGLYTEFYDNTTSGRVFAHVILSE